MSITNDPCPQRNGPGTLPHTDDDYRDFACEHLWYEATMIAQTLRVLAENQGRLPPFVLNLLAEAITMHGRLIEDFFFNTKGAEDSAIVQDYVLREPTSQRRWRTMRKRVGASPLSRERINREIVHLSYLRIYGGAPEKGWAPGPLVDWAGRMFLALFLVVDTNRFPAPLVERYRSLFTSVGVSHNPAVDPIHDPPAVEVSAEHFSMFDSIGRS